jgi:Fe-S-cluster containining protein
MNIIFPDGFNYDCTACGQCCRGWIMHIDERSHRELVKTDFYQAFSVSHPGQELFSVNREENTVSLETGERGFCVFQEDKLCSIHRALGMASKPLGCRQFPLRLKMTPDGIYVGLSFHCPSVQNNEGRPVSDYRNLVQTWIDDYPCGPFDEASLFLDRNMAIDWRGYCVLENALVSLLDDGRTLEEALWTGFVTLCVIVLKLRKEKKEHLEAEELARRITALVPLIPSCDDIFSQLVSMYTLTVVGTIESVTDGEAQANTKALMAGGRLKSKTYAREIDLAGFTRYQEEHQLPWKEAIFSRYMHHLLFSKFLVGPEKVVNNLAALYVACRLCNFYLYLSAYQACRPSPEVEDARRAIDIVEKDFTSHNNVMVPFFSAFVEGFIMQFEILQGGGAT